MSKYRPGVWVSWTDAAGVYHRVHAATAQIAKRWRRELIAEGATQIKIEKG